MSGKKEEYIQDIVKNVVFLVVALWMVFGAEDFRINIIGLFLSGFFFIKGYNLNQKLVKLQKREDKEVQNTENDNT